MDDLFFYSARILWQLLTPDSLFLILLIISLWLLWRGRIKKGIALLTLLTAGLLLLAIFPLGAWLLYPLESRFPTNPPLPDRVDGIIVLGGSVIANRSKQWGQLETNRYQERLDNFILLAKRYPQARLIFTGGNATIYPDEPTEADRVKQFLVQSGIAPARLMLEKRARNTAENGKYSLLLAKPGPQEKWILITSALHMPRAVGVFCRLGWRVIPYPVDHQTDGAKDLYSPGYNLLGHADLLAQALHEWIGLIAYYLSGKITQWFPADCDINEAARNDGVRVGNHRT